MTRRGKGSSSIAPLLTVALQDSIARDAGLLHSSGCSRCVRGVGRAHQGLSERRRRRMRDVEAVQQDTSTLTLAQRYGLAPMPDPPLSELQWSKVRDTSLARGDSTQPCPICQEDYGLKEQVLLSCSHVFHRVCLSSFEAYSGRKSCPLCRTSDYESRLVHDGAVQHRRKAAIRIQAAWRGFVACRRYRKYRESVPPANHKLRVKHFEGKLVRLTDHLVQCCNSSSNEADQLLRKVNKEIESSRSAMRWLDTVTSSGSCQWKNLQEKALECLDNDCVVCLCRLHSSTTLRELSLLSCGHVLHSSCISSLENFTSLPVLLCPICRTPYQRQKLCIPQN